MKKKTKYDRIAEKIMNQMENELGTLMIEPFSEQYLKARKVFFENWEKDYVWKSFFKHMWE